MDAFKPIMICQKPAFNIAVEALALVICIHAIFPAPSCAQAQQQLLPPMRYAPPEATFTGGNQLRLLQDEIDHQHLDAAATRLEALLRDSGDALMSQGEDGSVLSVNAWVQNLPAETKNSLRAAFEAADGAAAAQAVEEAQAKPDADPADFYSLVQRYPLSHASLAALAEAARRSALLGDVPMARWMLKAAVAGGWTADPALAQQIDQQQPLPASYLGAVPFEASWYASKSRRAWSALRSFPAAGGDVIFVVGPGQVMAIKENGAVAWKGPAGAEPSAGQGASATLGVTRGPPFSSSMLNDVGGTPQLLIVRQPEVHGNGWALRALRAEDGRLLWTTEGQDDYHGLVFGSNAAIEGRYVYAIAGEISDQLDHLWLTATEATTGQLLWRCDIGTVSRTIALPRGRNQSAAADVYRPWLNESAPAVSGNLVVISPNVGAVIAVDRFDGKLRWTRSYQTLSDPTLLLERQRDFAIEHPSSTAPPLISGLSLRWADTPGISGDTVISAPEDSDLLLAMNIHDGKPTWQSTELPDATLLGVGGGNVVMSDQITTGLDLATGKNAWTYSESAILGPSVLRGDTIYAPTANGVTTLSAKTGHAVTAAEKLPAFEAAIAAEPAHGVLLSNDAGRCFSPAVVEHNGRHAQRAPPAAAP